VSTASRKALEGADELVVAAISWWELAWLARHERIAVTVPIRSWLEGLLAEQVRTIGVTPRIADTAVNLPATFPRDPADRLIYATAIESGLKLVTKDQAIRDNDRPRSITVWAPHPGAVCRTNPCSDGRS